MHPLVKTLVLAALLFGLGGLAVWWYTTTSTEAAYEEAVADLQRQWTDRLGTVRAIEAPEVYVEEMRTLVDWYFGELQSLYNRYPEQEDVDRAWTEIQEQSRAGRIAADDLPDYEEFFTYVKDVFGRMRDGDYAPVVNDEAAGLHIDVYSVSRDLYEGVPRLRIDFALWGAPRMVDEKQTPRGTVRRVDVPLTFDRMFFQILDEEGRILGEMEGTAGGRPTIRIDNPQRWIAEFPPQAVLGTWWVPPFPAEAEQVVWKIVTRARAQGGSALNATFEWELDVPGAWKTSGDWAADAVEQVRSEAYIERREEEAQ